MPQIPDNPAAHERGEARVGYVDTVEAPDIQTTFEVTRWLSGLNNVRDGNILFDIRQISVEPLTPSLRTFPHQSVSYSRKPVDNNQMKDAACPRIRQEKYVVLSIELANAIVDPQTVVVHLIRAVVALLAVMYTRAEVGPVSTALFTNGLLSRNRPCILPLQSGLLFTNSVVTLVVGRFHFSFG